MRLLQIEALNKTGEDEFRLTNISFHQLKEERIAIAGETGSGKSTLLKCIAGLVDPDSGQILFKGVQVQPPRNTLVPGHERIAYLSQLFELPKFLRVEQVLEYANTLRGERATLLYQVCRIDHLLTRKTDQLSGGERQRIAIARLLSTSPDLLLLDEPFSHLDSGNKQIMKSVVWDICHKLKTTVMIVSHDPLDLLSWAQRILVLRNGRMVQEGTPEEIYRQPVDAYVAGLFGKYNRIEKGSSLYRKWKAAGKSGKSFLIRPESIRISKQNARSVKGRVSSVRYYGSYYEVDVTVGEQQVIVRASQGAYEPGESVWIAVASKDICYWNDQESVS